MKFLKKLTIDVGSASPNDIFHLHQNDVGSAELVIKLTENSQELALTGATVKYDASVRNILVAEDLSGSILDNKIHIPVTEQMTQLSGIMLIDVRIIENGETFHTHTIMCHVDSAVVNDGVSVDLSGITIRQQINQITSALALKANSSDVAAALALKADAADAFLRSEAAEVLPGCVENALENHPEWTTTVQDRSLTEEKLVVGALGYVTPEMFGAAGDGTTDDSQKILNAIGSGKPVVGYKNYNIGDGLCITRNGVSLSLFGKVTGTNGIKIKDCKLVNIYCRELEIINTAEEAYGICLRSDKGKEGNGGVTHCNIRVDKLSIYYKGLVDGTLKNIRSGVGVYFYATRYGYVNENVVTQTDIGAKVAIKFENNSLREMNSNLFYNIDIERSKPDDKTNVNGKGIILKTVNVDISDVDQSDIPESREGEEPPQEFPAKPIKRNRFFKIRTNEYDNSAFAFIGNISSNYFDCSAKAAYFDEYAKTEDTEIVSGKTYYTKSGSTYTAVAMPDTVSLSTYYELIQADTTAVNSNIFSGEFLTSSGWRLFTGFKVFYRDDSNGGFNDNKKGIAFAPIDRIKENSKEVDLDITIDPTASYANSYNHYTTFIANSSSATTITLSRGYIYGGIDHLRVIAVPDKMTPKIEDYKHDSIYSGGDTPTVRRIIDIYFEQAGPRIEAYDIYSKSEVEQMINSAIGGVENGSY